MASRLSTNEKLQMLIQGKEYDEDDEDIAIAKKEEEDRARNRLRRTSLYGGGARAKIPKVKKVKSQSKNPFTLVRPDTAKHEPQLSSAVPPGAHNDQYQLVQFPTIRNRNDMDRVFFTTQSMTEGFVHIPHQPPWYFGRQNKTEPADTNLLLAAARYGFRGSKNIKQRMSTSNLVGPPYRTRTPYTPEFLNQGDDIVDEWVPQIHAAKVGTINNLESPKLWPEHTTFPTGYPLKETPKSFIYKRETTVANPERPKTSHDLKNVLRQTVTLDAELEDYARMEKERTFNSLPIETQLLFQNAWSDRVSKTANATLRSTMRREVPPYEPHTLTDPSDTMRYSGSTAMIVHTQTTEELKFRLRMNQSKSIIPYESRWRHVTAQFKNLKSKLKRDQTMASVIREIALKLKKESISIGTPFTLTRTDFLTIISKFPALEVVPSQHLSLLYSQFDCLKKDSIVIGDLIACWSVLDQPLQGPIEKIAHIFRVMREFSVQVPNIDTALQALLSACGSDGDKLNIERLFKEEFRPACYRSSVFKEEEERAANAAKAAAEAMKRLKNTASNGGEGSTVSDQTESSEANNANGKPKRSNIQMFGRRTTYMPMRPETAQAEPTPTPASNMASIEEEETVNQANLSPTKQAFPKRRQSTLTGTVGEVQRGLGSALIQPQVVQLNEESIIASVQPVYNICNSYLNQDTFEHVLNKCPKIVQLYDDCLSKRLIFCYGKDARIPENEVESQAQQKAAANQDFSWLMGKKKSESKFGTISFD